MSTPGPMDEKAVAALKLTGEYVATGMQCAEVWVDAAEPTRIRMRCNMLAPEVGEALVREFGPGVVVILVDKDLVAPGPADSSD